MELVVGNYITRKYTYILCLDKEERKEREREIATSDLYIYRFYLFVGLYLQPHS